MGNYLHFYNSMIHGFMRYQQDHRNGESNSILTDKRERNINRIKTDRED